MILSWLVSVYTQFCASRWDIFNKYTITYINNKLNIIDIRDQIVSIVEDKHSKASSNSGRPSYLFDFGLNVF